MDLDIDNMSITNPTPFFYFKIPLLLYQILKKEDKQINSQISSFGKYIAKTIARFDTENLDYLQGPPFAV
uniref:Uncharacterized protein n=1 Tax=Arundo donax TaxID=35708 RepID=A0A0A9CF61_ARUDO